MRRFICLSVIALSLVAPLSLGAQEVSRAPVLVQTFNLRWISSQDAANLVSPYVQTPGIPSIGAFSAGPNMHAITVRGTKAMMVTVDSILRENDRQPATLVLRFQLIAGLDSAPRDPAIEDVDAALRGLFRFGGYKLLAQGSSAVSDNSQFLLTMGSGPYRYQVSGRAHAVQATGGAGSAELNVGLARAFGAAEGNTIAPTQLFSSGLTVALGQTVVLGSAAGSASGQALILTVHTELLSPQKP